MARWRSSRRRKGPLPTQPQFARAARTSLGEPIVIGRHHREREMTPGDTTADRLDALPAPFDWTDCAVH
jgi:hypothetical protein